MTEVASAAERYVAAVQAALAAIAATQLEAIRKAAGWCADAIVKDGMIFGFGTGHSHFMALEGHHRAGGLAAMCPVLWPGLMMHEGVELGTTLERTPGIAAKVLDRYAMQAGDVFIVVSNSGVNAVPVEAALHAKKKGLKVVAILALDYAREARMGPAGIKLLDAADLVIDNLGPPGDAVVAFTGSSLRAGPLSTVTGCYIVNAIYAETVERVLAKGMEPPLYISSNMPDADAHNAALEARYRRRNPHL